MKINSPVNVNRQPQTSQTGKSAPKSVAGEAGHVEEQSAPSSDATGRDFASVLEGASQGREKTDEQRGSERKEAAAAESTGATRRGSAKDSVEDEGGAEENRKGGAFDGRGGEQIREPGAFNDLRAESSSARAILHIADLERIVAAVRTQFVTGGQREVTLELSRSVLEGLRVKLSTDGAGRLRAEFTTASEKIRTLVEARSSELADLLRSRGVELASLTTTLGANYSGQNSSRDNRQREPERNVFEPDDATAEPSAPSRTDAALEDASGATPSTIYRA